MSTICFVSYLRHSRGSPLPLFVNLGQSFQDALTSVPAHRRRQLFDAVCVTISGVGGLGTSFAVALSCKNIDLTWLKRATRIVRQTETKDGV
jgi:hypothetical protein